jgi:hypothetical protein
MVAARPLFVHGIAYVLFYVPVPLEQLGINRRMDGQITHARDKLMSASDVSPLVHGNMRRPRSTRSFPTKKSADLAATWKPSICFRLAAGRYPVALCRHRPFALSHWASTWYKRID